MGTVVLIGLLVVALVVAAGLVVGRSSAAPAEETPRHGWKSETVTPVMLGPRNRAPERVSRPAVVTHGVILAFRMAASDGDVAEVERDAIRAFILDNVNGATASTAELALEQAADAADVDVDAAVEFVRAVASESQRAMLVDLLVHVAKADGSIRDGEVAFLERIGSALGLAPADVLDRLA